MFGTRRDAVLVAVPEGMLVTEDQPARTSRHARRRVGTAGVILAAAAALVTPSISGVAGSAHAPLPAGSTAGPATPNACANLPAAVIRGPQLPCSGGTPALSVADPGRARAAANFGFAGVPDPRSCLGLTLPMVCASSPATSNTSGGQIQADAAQTAGAWAIVSSPNTGSVPTSDWPFAVKCLSASDCWTVGYYFARADQTLTEHWDGTSWKIIRSPNTTVTHNNFLTGLTCVSTSDCWAVGGAGDFGAGTVALQTLVERWDGGSWTIVSSPDTDSTEQNVLNAVNCASTSDCWAVGASYNGTADQTLVEHWDGASWTIVSSADSGAAQSSVLRGVTCVAASDCWTVGFGYNVSGVAQTLVEHWDGTSWTIVSSPNVNTQVNILLDVTCVSTSDCWTVGFYWVSSEDAQTLTEHWDGTSWTIVSSPNVIVTAPTVLSGVTCVSTSDCWSVGTYEDPLHERNLIEHWDGTKWTIKGSPNIGSTQDNSLNAVTCVSTSNCWAVGEYINCCARMLMEHWDGTRWTVVKAPNRTAQYDFLLSVSCVSASRCWAVGTYINGNSKQTLVERWNGTSWAIQKSPDTSAQQDNVLYGVTCVSASSCWAVGYYFNGANSQTLVEHWDGTSWTIITSPNTSATTDNILNSVTCTSAADCWAVGQTLIEHWDGTSWTIVSSTTSPVQGTVFLGATCVSASQCWAVGYLPTGQGTGSWQTVVERWDGTSWAIVPSPNPAQYSILYSVSCVSASQCWAVGFYFAQNSSGVGGAWQPLITGWNGAVWTVATTPTISATLSSDLTGVTCTSATECWAVGGNGEQVLMERWDGTSWTVVSTPDTTAPGSLLASVTCVPASDCWAVGFASQATLTERLIH